MEKYFSIGSYNCLDAVMMNGCSADKVVEYMNKGIGDFHPYDEDDQTEISAEWLIEKYHGTDLMMSPLIWFFGMRRMR